MRGAAALPRARPLGRAGVPAALATLAVALTLALRFVPMERETYDTWGAILVAPMLFFLSLPILVREARRRDDAGLLRTLVAGLLLVFLGALARHLVAVHIYGGAADASGYHAYGVTLAERFSQGDFSTDLDSLTRTNFVRLLTGVVYTIIGTSRLGGYLFYAWMAYWGLFSFYKAFTIAMPEGGTKTYARLVFLYPSLLYWPAIIGKEAWMLLALGVAARGAARALSGRPVPGLLVAAVGLSLASVVRAPVALMMALGLVVAFVLRMAPGRASSAPVTTRVLSLAAVVGLAVVTFLATEEFLRSDLSGAQGVTNALESTAARSDRGGSEFDPVIVRSPQQLPEAVATVLFRPFLFEAGSGQVALAAVEATFLLLLSLVRIRWILSALRHLRRRPYAALAVVFVALFIVAFASFPNFGLLARQRTQMLPLYFVLLAVPPVGARRDEDDDGPA